MNTNGIHAKLPMSATNLSKSSAPPHDIKAVTNTVMKRNTFFCHLTLVLFLPLRGKRPVSMIRMAGKSWSGVDRRIAREYRNCTLEHHHCQLKIP